MLCAELKKDPVDENAVRLIMRVLKEREEGYEEVTPGVERAWEKYKEDSGAIGNGNYGHRKIHGLLFKAVATVAIVFIMYSCVPLNAEAESLFDKLIRWTESVFEFFGSRDNEGRLASYEFYTDNPGLQQVYDAVVDFGITEPVVPMWIPEEYQLLEIKTGFSPRKNCIVSRFSDVSHELVFEVNVCNSDEAHAYQKNETVETTFERDGATYHILKNNESWSVVWTKSDLECGLSIECQEEILYKIISSIYLKEDD